MTDEKIEITKEHINSIREKWDCKGMDDDTIVKAMIRYEKRRSDDGAVWLLEAICFPNFQSYLHHYRTNI